VSTSAEGLVEVGGILEGRARELLREACRRLSGRGPIPAAYDESRAGEG